MSEICYDEYSHTLVVNNKHINITRRELDLMVTFLSYPMRAWTRENLLDRVWANLYVNDRTVDQTVSRLRRRLKQHGAKSRIESVFGHGYRFVPHVCTTSNRAEQV